MRAVNLFIKVEPKDWMMHSVFLYFSDERRDAEDTAVRKYLSDHGLKPKREFAERVDDTDFDVMYFGGCYIGGGHLQTIRKMQETVVEREMLADEIRQVLGGSASEPVLDSLVEEFHPHTTFEVDDQGRIVVVMDSASVERSFARLNR